ncbi:MAG TPA: hypothetical protein VFK05_21935 [Polyangiaceae bacterium]|nr:hypothetical protein [Polyangiaceae bacterium]
MAGTVPSGPAMHEHLLECAQCRELFGDAELGRRLANVEPRATGDLTEQLLATERLIARERGLRAFLRSRSTKARWAVSLAFSAAFLVRELLCTRISLRELGALRVVAALLSFGLLGLVASSALRPWPLERRAARGRAVFAWLAWSLPCVLWFAPEARAGTDDFSSTGFALRSLTCFGYGSALSAPSVALLWAFDRGESAPYRVWALGAGWVALLSSAILLLHCPSTERAHLLAGHFSIGLAWFMAVSLASWWRSSVR